MAPIGYERENRQEGPHCTSGRSNSASPVWLPIFSCFSGTAGDFASPDVLLWPRQLHAQRCCYWLQAVAPVDVFDLLFWLAVAW